MNTVPDCGKEHDARKTQLTKRCETSLSANEDGHKSPGWRKGCRRVLASQHETSLERCYFYSAFHEIIFSNKKAF